MSHGRLAASGTSKYMVCFNRTVASYKKLSNVFSSVNDNSPEGHEDDDDDDTDLGVEVGVDLGVEVEVDLGVDDKADFEYEHEDENDDKVPLLVPLAPLVPLPPSNSPLQLAATSRLHQFQSSVQHHIEARQIERVVVLGRTSTFSTKQVSLDAQVGLLQHMLGDFEGDTRMLECNGVSAYEHDYLLEACKRDEKTLVLATSVDRVCRNPALIEDTLGSLDVMTFIHCDTEANCRTLADEWLNTLDESDQQTWRPILERQLSHTTSVKTAGITFPYIWNTPSVSLREQLKSRVTKDSASIRSTQDARSTYTTRTKDGLAHATEMSAETIASVTAVLVRIEPQWDASVVFKSVAIVGSLTSVDVRSVTRKYDDGKRKQSRGEQAEGGAEGGGVEAEGR
ncbi:hypothetical protein [Phaffia rhodozyma]|uniref:Uncharacterized protein n=1 Tax=Phaffia rhodozyma TaxID=264483 RepID=A0A0F7SXN6_PHARH|nr:hypothetical protein [Phaffia rhodozyma]